jgi:formate C-acetyltransferase
VLILLEASQRHILRYAALADEMAAAATTQRRKEPSPLFRAITRSTARKISGRPASCSGI